MIYIQRYAREASSNQVGSLKPSLVVHCMKGFHLSYSEVGIEGTVHEMLTILKGHIQKWREEEGIRVSNFF